MVAQRAYHTAAVKLEHARYYDDMTCLILLYWCLFTLCYLLLTLAVAAVQVQIGRMYLSFRQLRKVRGESCAVLVDQDCSADAILEAAVGKICACNQHLNKYSKYILLYPDGQPVSFLPVSRNSWLSRTAVCMCYCYKCLAYMPSFLSQQQRSTCSHVCLQLSMMKTLVMNLAHQHLTLNWSVHPLSCSWHAGCHTICMCALIFSISYSVWTAYYNGSLNSATVHHVIH